MSQRHREDDDLRDSAGIKAKQRGERQRSRQELQFWNGARDGNDLDGPQPRRKIARRRRRNPQEANPRDQHSHWKLKFWKRRAAVRQERAEVIANWGRKPLTGSE
jgi:hypothetical protein